MALHIYTASAGAGKTHTLTQEYLRLALSSPNPHTYATIQAVTFTKKATAEMKERIIEKLYELADRPAESPFQKYLVRALGITPTELQERARGTLRAMLLDYNAFRVRTIDSFFQEVVRAFARELGHAGAVRVDLNTDHYLKQAVQGVLSAQDEEGASSQVQQWIEQLLGEKLGKGKKFTSLQSSLAEFGRQLEMEAVKLLRAGHSFPSKDQLKQLRALAAADRERIVDSIKQQTQAILDLLKGANIEIADIKYGEGGALSAVLQLKRAPEKLTDKGNLVTDKARLKQFLDPASAPDSILKNEDKRGAFLSIASQLKSLTQQLVDTVQQEAPLYITSQELLAYADLYGLLIDLDTELQRLKQEEGVMFISDAPSLIASLLRDGASDAPFLYEKVGVRIAHHMIDEFQDTSRMQYTNFSPLLQESLSEEKDCLIVGDAKQSIYRFRNSDSTLLTTSLVEDFFGRTESHPLAENWRSTPEIIHFNNALYALLPQHLEDCFTAQWDEKNASLQSLASTKAELLKFLESQLKAYNDVEQKLPTSRRGAKGQVVLHRYGPAEGAPAQLEAEEDSEVEKPSDEALAQLPHVIISLQKQGYRLSDIAILVYTKATATKIASILQSYPEEKREGFALDFVSEEALMLSESVSVRFLIACMSYIAAPEQALRLELLQGCYFQLLGDEKKSLGEVLLDEEELAALRRFGRRGVYEMAEGLLERFDDRIPESEGAYVIKLLDLLYRWEQDQASDLVSFLAYWEEKGAQERIVSSASDNALQLMTIHKSKGLGFPVVLLPDLSWNFDPGSGTENILWCSFPDEPDLAKYRALGIEQVPVRYSSKQAQTFFSRSYYEEYLRYRLDKLNLLYVATTRPKQELHLWLPKEAEKKFDPLKKMSDFLLEIVNDGSHALPLIDIPVEEAYTYTSPLPAPQSKEATGERPIDVKQLTSYAIDNRLAVLREGLDYFKEESQRRFGNIMHRILSQIDRAEELDEAIAGAVRQGLISADQTGELTGLLRPVLDDPRTRHWFDGSARVYNEQEIIGGAIPTSRRPDRLVFFPDGHVEVIDYKFGHTDKRYPKQVRRYMELIVQMGYRDVRGFLCYLHEEGMTLEEIPLKAPGRRARP